MMDTNTSPNASSAAAIDGSFTIAAATSATAAETPSIKRDIVAEWRVPTKRRLHTIEFEHGTASGKRVLWVDGKEIFRRDWMFKLVGDDTFELDDGVPCMIRVNPASGMKFTYALYVDSKPFQLYKERQAKALKMWQHARTNAVHDDGEIRQLQWYRIVFEKDTLNIYLNGNLREEVGEFADDGGTDTEFTHDGHVFRVTARNGDNPRDGLVYKAYMDNVEIEECVET